MTKMTGMTVARRAAEALVLAALMMTSGAFAQSRAPAIDKNAKPMQTVPLPPAPVSETTTKDGCEDEPVIAFTKLLKVSGKIESLRTSNECTGKLKALEAVVVQKGAAAGKEKIVVRLAPTWFMQRAGLRLAVGDEITTRGVWAAEAEGDAPRLFLASEITKGPRRASVRNPEGKPRWRDHPG